MGLHMGYRELQGFKEVTGGYNRLHGVRGITRGYRGS